MSEVYFDPETPRLTYQEVHDCINDLPDEAVAELAKGPLPEGRCRACEVLAPHLPVHPSEPPDAQGWVAWAAHRLKVWHDDIAFSEPFGKTIEDRVIHPETYDRMCEEIHDTLGVIQYTRCCVIYAMALARTNVGKI